MTSLTRVQENMRPIIEVAELLLRKETRKRNTLVNLKFSRPVLELGQQWTFASNR